MLRCELISIDLGSKHVSMLTKSTHGCECRKDDDPVIPGPEKPAAVYEDKLTEKIRD
jgi:hypothetical protein